jgi:hypothetical protein
MTSCSRSLGCHPRYYREFSAQFDFFHHEEGSAYGSVALSLCTTYLSNLYQIH